MTQHKGPNFLNGNGKSGVFHVKITNLIGKNEVGFQPSFGQTGAYFLGIFGASFVQTVLKFAQTWRVNKNSSNLRMVAFNQKSPLNVNFKKDILTLIKQSLHEWTRGSIVMIKILHVF